MTSRGPARFLALVAVGAVPLAVACDDPPDPTEVPASAVLAAAIRHVVDAGATPAEADQVPVVYVVSLAEDGISAGTQADVASIVRDEIDVRFADQREEAIDDAAPEQPVVDGGVLLVVGEIPETGNEVAVEIEVYRDAMEQTKAIYTLAATGDEWEVTTTSLVPLDAP